MIETETERPRTSVPPWLYFPTPGPFMLAPDTHTIHLSLFVRVVVYAVQPNHPAYHPRALSQSMQHRRRIPSPKKETCQKYLFLYELTRWETRKRRNIKRRSGSQAFGPGSLDTNRKERTGEVLLAIRNIDKLDLPQLQKEKGFSEKNFKNK